MKYKEKSKLHAIISLWSSELYKKADSNGEIDWKDGHTTTDEEKSQIDTEVTRLRSIDAYQYPRKLEYPSIEDLVVALYDTDDKSAVEAKRASVKAKYPKPE